MVLREAKLPNESHTPIVLPINGFNFSPLNGLALGNKHSSLFAPSPIHQHHHQRLKTHRQMSPDQNTPQDLSVGSGGRNSDAGDAGCSSGASSLHSGGGGGGGGERGRRNSGGDRSPSIGRTSPNQLLTNSASWSYEEQFKQVSTIEKNQSWKLFITTTLYSPSGWDNMNTWVCVCVCRGRV